jgi:hypothetical protein
VFNGLRWEVVVCFVDLFCWSWLNITLLWQVTTYVRKKHFFLRKYLYYFKTKSLYI